MDKKIYKYTLSFEDLQTLSLPGRSEILSVCEQYGNMVLYAIVDSEITVFHDYEIRIYGTGHPVPSWLEDFTFLGTVKLSDGSLMFHVFYQKPQKWGSVST